MAAEVLDDHLYGAAALQTLTDKLGFDSHEALGSRVRRHEIDAGKCPGTGDWGSHPAQGS
ncbi:hypothetical protein [Streptomyces sp. CNQ085]|uniref:hypothetical protein n=1 Tax=Streptomyces sp. CNQ085 TaxID=2886944 RepID=UPI001F50552F|nr:hypothetical protein [Streptomyces sp. CNQ085]MCI0386350.1 hypothetical protein [Streptomyces sp. CNQ085]